MSDKKEIQAFFERANVLPSGERAALRRSAGKRYENAGGMAIASFMRIMSRGVQVYEEDIWFAVVCCSCIWQKPKQGAPFERALKVLEGDGIKRRLASILDENWNEDSLLYLKLYRLMKMLERKGVCPDFNQLLSDLLAWNHPERYVQKRWAREYFGGADLNNDNNKEEEN